MRRMGAGGIASPRSAVVRHNVRRIGLGGLPVSGGLPVRMAVPLAIGTLAIRTLVIWTRAVRAVGILALGLRALHIRALGIRARGVGPASGRGGRLGSLRALTLGRTRPATLALARCFVVLGIGTSDSAAFRRFAAMRNRSRRRRGCVSPALSTAGFLARPSCRRRPAFGRLAAAVGVHHGSVHLAAQELCKARCGTHLFRCP